MDETQNQNKEGGTSFAVPGAIVVAGLIIAGAIYYGGSTTGPKAGTAAVGNAPTPEQQAVQLEQMRPLGANDHILGNPNASIKIVEYSDLECPFCKSFHQTMQQLATAYPNQIAWVYRHFPLDQLHSQARKEAEATECAYELGGNEKFWAYTNKIFEVTPSNNGLDLNQLPIIAKEIGLDQAAFEACLASGRQAERVEADYQDAVKIGGRGTPFPVVIGPNNTRFALEGAVPLAGMKQLVDSLLAPKK